MVNKPLVRPYFLGGVALGGVARISMIHIVTYMSYPYNLIHILGNHEIMRRIPSLLSKQLRSFEPQKKTQPYFPLNPDCLIGILISWFMKSSLQNWVVFHPLHTVTLDVAPLTVTVVNEGL